MAITTRTLRLERSSRMLCGLMSATPALTRVPLLMTILSNPHEALRRADSLPLRRRLHQGEFHRLPPASHEMLEPLLIRLEDLLHRRLIESHWLVTTSMTPSTMLLLSTDCPHLHRFLVDVLRCHLLLLRLPLRRLRPRATMISMKRRRCRARWTKVSLQPAKKSGLPSHLRRLLPANPRLCHLLRPLAVTEPPWTC